MTNNLTKKMINKVEKITGLKVVEYYSQSYQYTVVINVTLATSACDYVGTCKLVKFIDGSFEIEKYSIGNVVFYLRDNKVYHTLLK